MMMLRRSHALRLACRSSASLYAASPCPSKTSSSATSMSTLATTTATNSKGPFGLGWLKNLMPRFGFRNSQGSTMSLHSTSTAGSTAATLNSNDDPLLAKKKTPVEHFRKDYKPSPYTIKDIFLDFDLDESVTTVCAKSQVYLSEGERGADLVLNGEELTLVSLAINSQPLTSADYQYVEDQLTISGSAIERLVGGGGGGGGSVSFELETVVTIHPDKNLALSGLYKSSATTLLSTQCEAMGFRRITFSLDRPDVLSRYRVRLVADRERYPLLLSNGNRIEQGDLPGTNKHYAVWEDPFPKPSYLFALVAGQLGGVHDSYTTRSGREVSLAVYSDPRHADKLQHALFSLKESMKWDEDTFGLECDLDNFNVVATDDFNMGAMENKGLNIFNSAYILADPASATDADYDRVLGVIGHEYFHNWSGNRVTVRDWFQLTLKEGLTVFRDQIISVDTSTVYSKGAEVVGIYKTLLGTEGFKKGLALYFERHDGQAVTCDDFRQAMADANEVDLSQMDRWYSQAGTPAVTMRTSYDASEKRFTITASQHYPALPGQRQQEGSCDARQPVVIPLVTGLLAADGRELSPSRLLILNEQEQSFVFDDIPEPPIVSTLRDYSAPVTLELQQTPQELAVLMAHDTDAFNRWEAAQRYYTSFLLEQAREHPTGPLPEELLQAMRTILRSISADRLHDIDLSLLAYALQLPDLLTLFNIMQPLDLDSLMLARKHAKRAMAEALQEDFRRVYDILSAAAEPTYLFNPKEVGRRRLRNTCLDYLSTLSGAADHLQSAQLAKTQFEAASCMTDRIAALAYLCGQGGPASNEALQHFHSQATGQPLVLNKWFSVQAMSDAEDCLDRLRALEKHEDFILTNPNRARSLYAAAASNIPLFHRKDGAGYEFIAQAVVKLDAINPQVAARLAGSFGGYKKLDQARREKVENLLRELQSQHKLSPDTFEIVSRFLN
eukprot:scaffold537_cov180-Ochromonas_danica.AAC.17